METASKRFRFVYANEWDKYACQVYRKHFGEESIDQKDITKVPSSEIPEHDIICGGFPCQSFSIAGKHKGFADTRGTLFYEIMRIADYHKPKMLFLENVKGLLSHDKGRTFAVILSKMDELGYDAEWQVLNSKNFGVPQNRERVFIIGHLRGEPRRKVFPLGKNGKLYTKSRGHISSTITSRYYKQGRSDPYIVSQLKEITKASPQGYRVYDHTGIATTLAGNAGGLGAKTGLYLISNASKREFKWKEISGAVCSRDYKEPKLVLLPKISQALQTDGMLRQGSSFGTNNPQSSRSIRKLTPLECERLQNFPDGYTFGLSNTQRYKTLGNAVTVSVIQAIAKRILEVI